MNKLTVLLAEVVRRVKRNPVLIATAVVWGSDTLSTGDPVTWRSALVVGLGVLVRSQVFPASEVIAAAGSLEDFID